MKFQEGVTFFVEWFYIILSNWNLASTLKLLCLRLSLHVLPQAVY